MSAAKKRKNTTSPAPIRAATTWLLGPGRTVLLASAVVAAAVGGLAFAWSKLGDRILSSPEYRLGPGQVEISPPPPDWIRSDLRGEVFRDPTLDAGMSILEADLCERIALAFERHPWVEKVDRVSKRHPASVLVELQYRRPACMVEVPGGRLPVDARGVLLPPEGFTPLEAARYPRLAGVDQMPSVPPGRRWPDPRVIGAAEIAEAIGAAWGGLGLKEIFALAADPTAAPVGGAAYNRHGDDDRLRQSPGRSVEPFFALVTPVGTQILWGYAPGANAAGELPAEEKVARLKRYLAEHDTLDARGGRRQDLDVRTLPPSVAR